MMYEMSGAPGRTWGAAKGRKAMSPVIESAIRENRPLTADETREYALERIRETFGIDLEEFTRRFQAGEFEDHPAAAQIAALAGVEFPPC